MAKKTMEGLKNQEDVNPSTQLDKILNEETDEHATKLTGTGSNNPVPTTGSVIVEKPEDDSEDQSS